jgi:hypothetical protein
MWVRETKNKDGSRPGVKESLRWVEGYERLAETEPTEASEMNITTVGIDLAKTVFQLHGVDAQGHTVFRKQLRREQMAPFFANLPPCLVGMEACGSAHFWAAGVWTHGALEGAPVRQTLLC